MSGCTVVEMTPYGARLDDLAEAYRVVCSDWDIYAHLALSESRGPRHDEVNAMGRNHGAYIIGAGAGRACFDMGDGAVLKVEHHPEVGRALTSSRIEALVWMTAPSGIRAHLVPVLLACPFGNWVLMPRKEVMSAHGSWDMPLDTRSRLRAYGILDVDSHENRTASGKILDYGNVKKALYSALEHGPLDPKSTEEAHNG